VLRLVHWVDCQKTRNEAKLTLTRGDNSELLLMVVIKVISTYSLVTRYCGQLEPTNRYMKLCC